MNVLPIVRVVPPSSPPAMTPKLARLLMQMASEHADRSNEERIAA